MKTTRLIEVPTGHILVVDGEKGPLECMSLGDYGREHNVKAAFLGLDRDLGEVKHRALMPLEDKWVITISTQYGCSMRCNFCDVPKVGPGRNATFSDLVYQFWSAFSIHPEVDYSNRINLHYARMGEPTWNPAVIRSAYAINERLKGNHTAPFVHGFDRGPYRLHPVVSTMMPRMNRDLPAFIRDWIELKNDYLAGEAGLQLSINSTDNWERTQMFAGNSMFLEDISDLMAEMPAPKGRKYTLNFAVADWRIDADRLAELFDPDRFMVKLTPMHKTTAALSRGIETKGDYATLAPYQHHEAELRRAGFDVLVFVASKEEDLGRITCGNAILAGTEIGVEHRELK